MKNILKLSLLLVGLVALVYSCRKEELDLDSLTDFAPGIASITPADKEVLASGTSFDLKAKFVSGSVSTLSSATIRLINEGGTEVKSVTKSVAGTADSVVVAGADFSASSLPVGKYTITVEVKDVKGKAQTKSVVFSIGIIPQIGIIGSATAKGWGEDTDMTNLGNGVYEIVIDLAAGEVKFRQDNDWAVNWGAKDFPSGVGTQGGPNIPVPAGKWKVTFKPSTGAYSFANAVTYASKAKELYLLGGFNNFEGSQYPFNLVADNTWVLNEILIKPGTLFKFSEGPAFMGKSWGDNEGDGKAEEFGKNISFSAPEGEAYYKVTFNDKTLKYSFTFLKYPAIGIIGSGTPGGWNTDTDMTNKGDGTFEVLIDLVAGEVKFRANKDWGTNWGGTDFPEGIATLNGPNIPVTAGKFKVVFNPATGAYKFTPDAGITSVGIIGSATPGGWGAETAMADKGAGNYEVLIDLIVGEAKFRANNDWAINWGAADFPAGVGTQGGANIPIATAGKYKVTFNANTGAYNFAPGIASVGIIGSATPGGWGAETPMTDKGGGNYEILIGLSGDECKFRANNAWDVNWGAADFPAGVGTQGGANIKVTKGIYLVTFNSNTGAYNFAPASIGIIGDATPGGWGADTNMDEDAAAVGVVKLTVALLDKECKFRANDAWDINWGGTGFPTGTGTQNGPNIKVPAAKTYTVTFNVNTGAYDFQ